VIAKTNSPALMIFSIGIVIFGYFVPDLLIYNAAVKRQELIQKALPDTLDQIVISIEAGVGFEAALSRAGENGEGPLAEEIIRLIQDMSLGMSRREAYLGLVDRTSVDELRNFARAIVQAEQYGVSIASVVRTQAKEMRIARRSRAEAKAQQVPVKILMPLMLCILPVLFVIVLGPAVVHAYAIN
jgi:tight adherence protein C